MFLIHVVICIRNSLFSVSFISWSVSNTFSFLAPVTCNLKKCFLEIIRALCALLFPFGTPGISKILLFEIASPTCPGNPPEDPFQPLPPYVTRVSPPFIWYELIRFKFLCTPEMILVFLFRLALLATFIIFPA